MVMTDYRFTCTLPLERHDVGRYVYQVVYAPPEVQAELLAHQRPRVRISGEVEGLPVNLAWQPSGDGRLYLMIGADLRSALRLALGDTVTVRFNIADPSEVVVPPELAEALAQEPFYAHLWERLTPGRKRALAQLIAGARSSAARGRRLREALDHLEHDTSPQHRRRRPPRPDDEE